MVTLAPDIRHTSLIWELDKGDDHLIIGKEKDNFCSCECTSWYNIEGDKTLPASAKPFSTIVERQDFKKAPGWAGWRSRLGNMMMRRRRMMMMLEQVGKLVAFISSLVRGNAVEPEVSRVFLHQFLTWSVGWRDFDIFPHQEPKLNYTENFRCKTNQRNGKNWFRSIVKHPKIHHLK